MPEINEARYNEVFAYIVSQGTQPVFWPSMASIIATAIEVALNYNEPTTDEPTR